MTIDIEDIQKISLNETDILVVTVDTKSLPKTKAEAYMLNVKELLTTRLGIKNQILCVPTSVVFSKIEAGQLEN